MWFELTILIHFSPVRIITNLLFLFTQFFRVSRFEVLTQKELFKVENHTRKYLTFRSAQLQLSDKRFQTVGTCPNDSNSHSNFRCCTKMKVRQGEGNCCPAFPKRYSQQTVLEHSGIDY